MLPFGSHDERSREEYVAEMRRFLMSVVYPRLRPHYEAVLAPAFAARTGARPRTPDEVRTVMEQSTLYQGFSLLTRGTQELLWDTVGEIVDRQQPTLMDVARDLAARGGPVPVLQAGLPVPEYIAAVDIHVMPGGYHTETATDDVFAGALYDRGVYLYAFGGLGPLNEELGQATVAAVARQFPGWQPGRILDLGCGVGHSTLPLATAFPQAQVHGVDLGAPMVRYGAARAAALGFKVHFSQQDATRTAFADASFDLVTSTLLLHEMPRAAILALLRECARLLRPGGVMVHHDLLRWPEDPFDSFMMSWTTRHNNEPYERASGTLDFARECEAAGFPSGSPFVVAQPGVYLEEVYQVSGIRGARKTPDGP